VESGEIKGKKVWPKKKKSGEEWVQTGSEENTLTLPQNGKEKSRKVGFSRQLSPRGSR